MCLAGFSELIDTWWDVNFFTTVLELSGFIELIDTWWDVNYIKVIILKYSFKELIDTWWDVNQNIAECEACAARINRYMVGCKYLLSSNSANTLLELIDTWWDVNC